MLDFWHVNNWVSIIILLYSSFSTSDRFLMVEFGRRGFDGFLRGLLLELNLYVI